MTAPQSQPLAGRFVIEREVGRGGVGIVYRAQDLVSGQAVALKVIALPGVDAGEEARFRREGRVLAGLHHPGIVRVVAFGQLEEGQPYIAMEWLEGEDLAQRQRRSPLVLQSSLNAAADVCEALAAAHAAGIVHRDVKPSNVLMGGDQRIRLTDFGIAQPESGTQLTLTGQVMGTLRYLAPEVKAGGRSTPRSDLYASGILLGDVLVEPADRALAELVRRLRHEDAARRPASAAEALAALPGASSGDARRGRTAPQPQLRSPSRAVPVAAGPLTSTSRHNTTAHDAGRRARAALALICACAAVVALAVLALGGSGGAGAGTPRPSVPPAGAPLSAQLDAIERAVRQGAR
jgi:serine/threonine protein kinase